MNPGSRHHQTLVLCLGVFFVCLAAFVLSGPGRIDSIDGQIKFEVTRNLVEIGRPALRDPIMAKYGIPGTDGLLYSGYGPAPSYLAVPLVWLGLELGDPVGELARFLFSFLNAFACAGAVAILLLFYLDLGIAPRTAVSWSLVAAFGSMVWIGATTVLEQGQHTLFAIASLYLAWRSSREKSISLAAGAGLTGGVLMLYQPSYALIQPVLAIATLSMVAGGDRSTRARGLSRYLAFGTASAFVLVVYFLYNYGRLGTFLPDPHEFTRGHPPLTGNPLIGIPSLLFSPGKSILLFSPTVVLGIAGLRRLNRLVPSVGWSIMATSAVHLLFIGSLSIFHGDWCWGPRYLIVLLPLLALGFPFAIRSLSPLARSTRATLILLGVLANLLGLSLVQERFFHERDLRGYFWYRNARFYYSNSTYFARIGEILDSVRHPMPAEATSFNCSPYRGLLTYVIAHVGPREPGPVWIRRCRVFYEPRPWPFWLAIEREHWADDRGLSLRRYWLGVSFLAALATLGGVLLRRGSRTVVEALPAAGAATSDTGRSGGPP